MNVACEVFAKSDVRSEQPKLGPISVASGFMWVLAGYMGYMACQWGMIVALARWGSVEVVGQFHLALATTAPIILFTNLGLRRVYATDSRGEFGFKDYLGLRLGMSLVALVLIAGIALVGDRSAAMVWVLLAMGVAKAIESISDILHGYFQNCRRIDIGARSTLLKGPVSLLTLIAGFLLTRSALGAVVGMAAGWLAVVLFYDLRLAARLRRQESAVPRSPGAKFSLARLSLPMGIVALITSLRANIPTLVIAAFMEERWLGLFGALIYFHAASNRVVSALGEAATTPLASRYLSGDRDSYVRLLGKLTWVALAISGAGLAVAALAGREILGAFYGPEYAKQAAVLVVVMASVAAANLQTILDYAMTAARRFKIQPYLYGAGALVLFALCAVLVPSQGIRGAALALGLGSVIEIVASAVIVAWAVGHLRAATPRPGAGTA